MKQLEQPRAQARKRYAQKGEKAQKMITFRLDIENLDWLSQQPNKGRYINELIASDRKARGHR